MTNNSRMKQAWDSRTAFWIAAIFVAVIVILAVVILINGHGDGEPKSKPTASASSSSSADGSATADPMAQQFVTLPAPTTTSQAYPTTYPHTPQGAVATVLAHTILSSQTLEYDAATSVETAYLHNAPYSAEKAGETSVAGLRQTMGLSLSGPAPAGASVKLTVDGVKWKTVAGGDVDVSIDYTATYNKPDGSTITRQGAVVANEATWVANRWWIDGTAKVAGTEQTKYLQPGSVGFVSAGWKVIKNDDWTGGLL